MHNFDGDGRKTAEDTASAGHMLPLVLHACPDLTAQPRDIAAMLQVCRTWALAVRDCHSHSTDASHVDLRKPSTLAALAAWLPGHAGLLASLKADRALWLLDTAGSGSGPPDDGGATLKADMQHAAAAGSLQLRSFSSNFLHAPGLLAALSGTLTHLELSGVLDSAAAAGGGPAAASDPAFVAALSSMRRLQHLHLGAASVGAPATEPPPAALLAALRALPRLLRLGIKGAAMTTEAQQQLSARLTALVLDGASFPAGPLDLRHMTGLLALDLAPSPAALSELLPAAGVAAKAAAGALLPRQLRALTMLTARMGRTTLDLFQVPQLQSLTIRDSQEAYDWLLMAATRAAAPSLTHLSLTYTQRQLLLTGAPAWCDLPALRHVGLRGIVMRDATWEGPRLHSFLLLASSVTSLSVQGLQARVPPRAGRFQVQEARGLVGELEALVRERVAAGAGMEDSAAAAADWFLF